MRYEHDCDRCQSLGEHVFEGRSFNLYYCEVGGLPDTVIARYGDDGPDYESGLAIAEMYIREGMTDHPLVIALARARERGLVK